MTIKEGSKCEHTCANCAWLGRGTCKKLDIVPMSIDGKGRRNCPHWDFYKRPIVKEQK